MLSDTRLFPTIEKSVSALVLCTVPGTLELHTSAISQYLHQAWLMSKMDHLPKAAGSVIFIGGGRVNEAGVIPLHRILMSFSCLGAGAGGGEVTCRVRVKTIKETHVSPWELSQFYSFPFSKA